MSTMLLPDMPRASKQCRLCQLVAASEDWARLLYTYRFDRKLGLRELPGAMAPHIESWNKDHPDQQLHNFSVKAASKHFTKHVPTAVSMQYLTENKMNVVKRTKAEQAVPQVVTQQIEQQVAKSVKVFDELQDLFAKLKKLFETYLQTKPEISALTIHLDIIREMRKTLAEISKMRQSKELIKIAVRSVIDTFIRKMIEESGRAVDTLRDDIVKKTGDKHFANEVTDRFRKTLADLVIESARTAIDRVRVEFALDEDKS